MHPDDLPGDNLATDSDACREYASHVGFGDPETAWICTPHDTWERNPSYIGPLIPHPESVA